MNLNKLYLKKENVVAETDGYTCISCSLREDMKTGEVLASVEIAARGKSSVRVKFPPEYINDALKRTLKEIAKELEKQERNGLDPEIKIDLVDASFRAWALQSPFSSGASGEARGIKILDDDILLDTASTFTNTKK